jgi:hypothetical protein
MKDQLIQLLNGRTIHGSRSEFYCTHADNQAILFAPTPDTGKIMIPTDLAVEWVRAYQHKRINLQMPTQEIRTIVKVNSEWAAFLHGFDSQLYAIVKTWAEAHPQ